jgi:hypothetical protein
MKKYDELIECAVCKAKFNVLKADWCKHNPRHTKLCPNGHCICDRLDSGIWKEANETEKLYGIERVYLGNTYGGLNEPKGDDTCPSI